MSIGIPEMTERLAREFNISSQEARACIDAFRDKLAITLKSGDRVSFRGFGVFYLTKLDREVRNPKTGEVVGRKLIVSPRFRPYDEMVKVNA